MSKVKKIINSIAKFFKNLFKKIGEAFKHFFRREDKEFSGFDLMVKTEGFKNLIASIICIIAGLLLGFIIIIIVNPAHSLIGIGNILKGGFNAPVWQKGVGAVLVNSVPLLMCSLSIIFAYKCGLFNIGAPGQYVVGLMFAFLGVFLFNLPWYLCILLAAVGGALWGVIPGIFKAFLNVNEVITSIMFNWIGLYLLNYVAGAEVDLMFNKNLAECKTIPSASLIPTLGIEKLFSGYKYVTIAIFVGIIVAIIINFILNKTRFGYEIKATGNNKDASIYAGMNAKKNIIITMAIAGALAGIGAACFYLTGYEVYSPVKQTSLPAVGFNGIAVAFLGGLSPIGAIFASLFITHITIGGGYLDTTYYSSETANLISSIIIYLCAFSLFIKLKLTELNRKKENRRKEKIKDENNIGGKE